MLGRDLKDVIIVDNSYECFAMQPENGFLISSFFDDMTDDELIENLEFFIQLSEDVREVEYWKEQFDNMIKDEEDQIESLNEIQEDSNEQIQSPLQSQFSNLRLNDDRLNDEINEQQQSDSSLNEEEIKQNNESKKRLSEDIDIKGNQQEIIQKFAEGVTNYEKEVCQRVNRKKKQSKTVVIQNNNKKIIKPVSSLQKKNPLQKFWTSKYGTMKQFADATNQNKTYTSIEEAGFQRVKNRTNSQLNIKIDYKRFDKDHLMSPLRKDSEYYSKHSQLFFVQQQQY